MTTSTVTSVLDGVGFDWHYAGQVERNGYDILTLPAEKLGVDAFLPALDVPLLNEIVAWAESEDKKNIDWDQTTWAELAEGKLSPEQVEALELSNNVNFCDTAYCLAGYVSHVFNNINVTKVPIRYQDRSGETYGKSSDGKWYAYDIEPKSGNWSVFAAEKLGLTEMEMSAFFNGNNRVPTIKRLARQFAKARGVEDLLDF